MIKQRPVPYTHHGTQLEGMLVYDDSWQTAMPGVMVCHAWAGRGPREIEWARCIAEEGYAAFAVDLYGKGVLGRSKEENMALMTPFMEDRALLQERLKVALKACASQDIVDEKRIAAIGFCFGGLCVLDMARSGADVVAVVSFHGLFTPPGNTEGNRIRAKVLALHGNDDPMVPHADVMALADELTAAGADWQIHVYGRTMHAFTNPDANDPAFGTVYNEIADRRARQALDNFLEELF
jgi:dienelactone hydrolase